MAFGFRRLLSSHVHVLGFRRRLSSPVKLNSKTEPNRNNKAELLCTAVVSSGSFLQLYHHLHQVGYFAALNPEPSKP